MRTVGLITEYNPFHNGHLHHLQESLRVTGADASVAVMSGHFLQRGEPALVDKWLRTEMALAAGVDLVLELPFSFACNSAPHFAAGAVQSLKALGVVDTLCFGSEAGEIAPLAQVARVLVDKRSAIEGRTAQMLREGVNFPSARATVLAELLPGVSPEQIASPNNLLGIEYLRALEESGGGMTPHTIQRIGAGFHATNVVDEIASATGIRARVFQGEEVATLMPTVCIKILESALASGFVLDYDKLFQAVAVHLLQEPETLLGLYHVEDGLQARLGEAALTAASYVELAGAAKSRQWTLTRIQRILSYVLMKADAKEMQGFVESGPLYLRLLGAGDKGREILAKSRKSRSLPVIDDPAKAPGVLRRFYKKDPGLGRMAERMLAYDLRATRLHGLLTRAARSGHRNRDYFVRL